jgi:hypothetical protein
MPMDNHTQVITHNSCVWRHVKRPDTPLVCHYNLCHRQPVMSSNPQPLAGYLVHKLT